MTFDASKLSNKYYVIRHGSSKANEEELIVSNPNIGVPEYGLTTAGKDEVIKSATDARDKNILDESTIIVSSDFLRTRETAALVANVLNVKEVVSTPKLRERYFGEWDTKHNSNYREVWVDDEVDHTHTKKGVESVADVLARAISLIDELENKYSSKKILLVSHGDTLQILQTAFTGVHPSRHRSLEHLKTAEIRRI